MENSKAYAYFVLLIAFNLFPHAFTHHLPRNDEDIVSIMDLQTNEINHQLMGMKDIDDNIGSFVEPPTDKINHQPKGLGDFDYNIGSVVEPPTDKIDHQLMRLKDISKTYEKFGRLVEPPTDKIDHQIKGLKDIERKKDGTEMMSHRKIMRPNENFGSFVEPPSDKINHQLKEMNHVDLDQDIGNYIIVEPPSNDDIHYDQLMGLKDIERKNNKDENEMMMSHRKMMKPRKEINNMRIYYAFPVKISRATNGVKTRYVPMKKFSDVKKTIN